jgi:3-oxoacyl-[acyl-carrier-protein] synthase II
MSEEARRVVITGLGAVTALGADLARSAAAWRRGGAAPTTGLAPAAPGEQPRISTVPDFDPGHHFTAPKALKLCDRRTRLAVAAAAMALADAGLAANAGAADGREIGVVLGTSSSDPGVEDLARPLGPFGPLADIASPLGPLAALAPLVDTAAERAAHDVSFFAERILGRLHPLWLLVQLPNMASAHVAIQLGLQGPNSTIMTDGSAGAQAIGEGYRWVQQGEAEAVLAGGADTGATQLAQISYRQCGLFAGRGAAHEPALAEGAAVLVLEERSHALARGATIYGEIAGYAAAGEPREPAAPDMPDAATAPDAHEARADTVNRPPESARRLQEPSAPPDEPWRPAKHGTGAGSAAAAPAGSGLARAMRQALAEAGWDAASIGCLLAGGTASGAQLRAEEEALTVLGCAPPPCRFDPTPRLGHALAAQAPIVLCLALALPVAGTRLLCSSVGLLGQAVGLAIARTAAPDAPTAASAGAPELPGADR